MDDDVIYVAWDSHSDTSLFASNSPTSLKHRCDKLGYDWVGGWTWDEDDDGYQRFYWYEKFDKYQEYIIIHTIPFFEIKERTNGS